MSDIEFKLKFDDSELLQGMQNVKTSNAEIKKGIDDITKSTEEMGKAGAKAAEQNEEGLQKSIELGSEVRKGLLDALQQYGLISANQKKFINDSLEGFKKMKNPLTALKDSYKNLGSAVGNFGKSLAGLGKGTSGVIGAFRAAGVAARAFGLALVSTGVGAIVVALGLLVTYLIKSGKAAEVVGKVMRAIGATIEIIVNRISKLGEAVFKVLKGDFKGAAETASSAVKGIGTEITDTIKKAEYLEIAISNLEKASRAWMLTSAELEAQIDDLMNIANDGSKSYAERLKAINDAQKVSQQLNKGNIELLNQELANVQEKLEKNKEDKDLLDEEAKLQLAIFNEERKGYKDINKLKEDGVKINEDRIKKIQEEEKKVQQLKDAYEKLIEKFNEQVQKAELSLITDPMQRALKELEIAMAEIDLMEATIRASAMAAGKALPEGFEEGFKTLRQDAAKEISELIKEQAKSLQVSPLPTYLEQQAKEARDRSNKIRATTQKETVNWLNKFQKEFNAEFNALFGLKGQEEVNQALGFLQAAGQDTFKSILDIAAANFQRALGRIDAQINSSKENIQSLTSQLEEERKKQEQGYANDVGLLEKKLADEQRVLVKAENDKLALQKKQARQQLVIDSALQASQITLGIAKLISSEASKGLIGLFAAASGIALLFSILAKSKAQAASLQDIPKFREGTEYLSGKSHEQGGVLIEAEGGERILSKKLNAKLKMSNEQLVNYALIGEKMIKGFGALANDRKADLFRYEQSNALYTANMIKDSIYGAMNENSDRLIDYWKTRPVVIPTPTGTIAESYEGSTKVRKKYRMI
jgi:hypothetical protein